MIASAYDRLNNALSGSCPCGDYLMVIEYVWPASQDNWDVCRVAAVVIAERVLSNDSLVFVCHSYESGEAIDRRNFHPGKRTRLSSHYINKSMGRPKMDVVRTPEELHEVLIGFMEKYDEIVEKCGNAPEECCDWYNATDAVGNLRIVDEPNA